MTASDIAGSAAPPRRDVTLDVLKGLGIILMVIGHSGFPYTDFIYRFHMAVFFMASGYVWNDKKAADIPSLKRSLLSRVKGLWLPYVLGNGTFALLNNVFVRLLLYPQESRMTLAEIAVNFAKILLFSGHTQLGGAFWFLRTLFVVSVVHLAVRFVATHWKYGKAFYAVVVVSTLAGAVWIDRTGCTLPFNMHTFFSGYTAFLMGALLRRYSVMERTKKYSRAMIPVGLALLVFSPLDRVEMGVGSIGSLPLFVLVSYGGWFMLWGLASLLKGPVADAIAYCGRHSVWIVALHFLAFKPVIVIYLLCTGGSMAKLSSFPIMYKPWLWIAYTIAGVALPLAVHAFVTTIKATFRRLIR